jgi:hypothetical protein
MYCVKNVLSKVKVRVPWDFTKRLVWYKRTCSAYCRSICLMRTSSNYITCPDIAMCAQQDVPLFRVTHCCDIEEAADREIVLCQSRNKYEVDYKLNLLYKFTSLLSYTGLSILC